MNQTKEILLLEDEDTGKIYAKHLQDFDKSWNVTWARSISDVKKYKDLDNLHVFIFDQRIGVNELGTDAFKYVHEKNPRIQGIMLSGMARAQDLRDAETIVGSTIQYINKTNAINLTKEVKIAIGKYYMSLPKIEEHKKLKTGFGFRLFSRKPEVILLYYSIIDSNYVFPNEWKVDVKIRSGEKVKRIRTAKNFTRNAIIKDVTTSLSIDSEINSKFIKTGLENRFKLKLNSKSITGIEVVNIDERSYELSKKDESNINLVQRNYEYNQVFMYCRVHLSIKCSTCKTTHYEDYDVYIPQNKILERCIEYFPDSKKVIPLYTNAQ